MSDTTDDMEAYSGFLMDDDDDSDFEKIVKVLDYCKPHLDKMWAATIVGILLDCDFRDAKVTLEEWYEEN